MLQQYFLNIGHGRTVFSKVYTFKVLCAVLITLCIVLKISSIFPCIYFNWTVFCILAVFLSVSVVFKKNVKYHINNIIIPIIATLYLIIRGGSIDVVICVISCGILIYAFSSLNNINSIIILSFSFIGILTSLSVIIGKVITDNVFILSDSLTGLALNILFGVIAFVGSLRNRQLSIWLRYNIYACIFVSFVALLILQSRTSFLALISLLPLFKNKKYRVSLIVLSALFAILISISSSKIASTYGRSAIYQTSLTLIDSSENLIFGRGFGGFEDSYMIQQSRELENKSEDIKQRADNIKHPLNEFLLIVIEFGFVGFLIYVLFLYKSLTNSDKIIRSMVIAIIVLSLFTYPLRYPSTWIVLCYASSAKNKCILPLISNDLFFTRISKKIYSFGFGVFTLLICTRVIVYSNWVDAYDAACIGSIDEARSLYKRTSLWPRNSRFIYNYAYFEMCQDDYNKALEILSFNSVNDYETSMLKANIYFSSNDYDKALAEYILAEKMCPNRFFPIFGQFQVYEKTRDIDNLNITRNKILTKTIKVQSNEIKNIINYVSEK